MEVNKSSDNTNGLYYGVHIPTDVQIPDNEVSVKVYEDKDEALQLLKKYKKARFKAFNLYEEAFDFAYSSPVSVKKQEGQPQVGEKPSQFKGQTPQNLVILRKAVEKGDVHFVYNKVWENPRYLIGAGDTPSILQEGARYNAMHVAAKSKSYEMCELLLNTISDLKFIKKMYPDDKNPEVRAKMLLDLYLNTPDKGLNETPLHFAVKFGAVKCVEVLVSFKQCDKNVRNKHGHLPKEIICSRYDGDDTTNLKKQITLLLEETYYVPVLRTEDNCAPPMIGEPFSPTEPPKLNSDPLSPRLEIHAYAGPMDKECANKFRKLWKAPQRGINRNRLKSETLNSNDSHDFIGTLKFRDPEKGLERVGNDLARKMEVSWNEYWPFLDCFIDIASKEGLDLFEIYLHKKMCNIYNICSNSVNDISHSSNSKSSPGNHLNAEMSPMTELCHAFQAFNIRDGKNGLDHQLENFQNNLNPLLCIDKSLQVFARRISVETLFLLNMNIIDSCHNLDGQIKQLQSLMISYIQDSRFKTVNFQLVHLRLSQLIKSHVINSLQDLTALNKMLILWLEHYNVYISEEEGIQNGHINIKSQHAKCILNNLQECLNSELVYDVVNNEEHCVKVWNTLKPCNCLWKNSTQKKHYSKRENRKLSGSNKFIRNEVSRKLFIEDGFNMIEKDGYSSSEDDFFTPPSSPGPVDESDDENDIFNETNLPDVEVFIEEEYPTKTDWAVFNAFKYANCKINSVEFPNIYKWYHVMSLCKESEKQKSSTPSKSLTVQASTESSICSPVKSWIRITGVNSPRATLKCHQENISFNL